MTTYSDMEPLGGNFSNEFEEGSKYFAIKGVNPEESIAVEAGGGKYLRADRDGEYLFTDMEETNYQWLLIPGLAVIFVLLMSAVVLAEIRLKK